MSNNGDISIASVVFPLRLQLDVLPLGKPGHMLVNCQGPSLSR